MLYKLEGFVNCSKWGKVGNKSFINRFLRGEDYLNSHLAELWFGTHANGMSRVEVGGTTIFLESYLNSIGEVPNLPYLAKILSVNSPLSIQLHPPKEIAEQLHAGNPKNYPDSEAKPEMSIALTEVKLLCGIRDLNTIRQHVSSISAFRALGEGFQKLLNIGSLRELSRYIFNLQKSELDLFVNQIFEGNLKDEWSKIVLDLLKSGTPIDPGIVYLYLLEYLTIQPGQAIFIEPGVPHAYISGDMFECMQASDNVVRGGLTAKYIDSKTFIDLFREVPYDSKLLPISLENGVKEYRPPNCPFIVKHLHSSCPISFDVPAQSILINLEGVGEIRATNYLASLARGVAYFSLNICPNLKVIPESTLEMFIISPN